MIIHDLLTGRVTVHHEAAPDGGNGGSAAAVLPPGALSADDAQRLRNENLVTKIQLARAQAMMDFPQADRELLDLVGGTPEEIRTAAEKMHTKALAAAAAAAPAPTPAPTSAAPIQPGAAPVPGPDGAQPVTGESVESFEEKKLRTRLRSNTLRTQVDQAEAQIAYDNGFRRGWNQHMLDRKTGRSSVSAGDAPPVTM